MSDIDSLVMVGLVVFSMATTVLISVLVVEIRADKKARDLAAIPEVYQDSHRSPHTEDGLHARSRSAEQRPVQASPVRDAQEPRRANRTGRADPIVRQCSDTDLGVKTYRVEARGSTAVE